jgi:hypothetical protein
LHVRAGRKGGAVAAIAVGTFLVGSLDLAYAIAVYSPHQPILIPQTIASGVLGARSYDGGLQSAMLGVLLQYVIALGISTIYYLASRKLPFLVERPVPWGMFYGAAVYCVMHALVVPLSAAAHHAIPRVFIVTEFVEHWFFVGLPVALSVRAFSPGGGSVTEVAS